MIVYLVRNKDLGSSCVWQHYYEAIAEISMFFDENEGFDSQIGNVITLEISEMSKEEFENLPEFEGY